MTSEDHNQSFTIFRLISKSQSRGAARRCFVFCLFLNASHPAEQYLRKRDVEHLAIGSCFEDGDSYGDGPSGVRGLSTSSRCLERTADIRLIDPAVRASGTMIKTTRPLKLTSTQIPSFTVGTNANRLIILRQSRPSIFVWVDEQNDTTRPIRSRRGGAECCFPG